ncbi:MAG: anthranilate synthase component I family protein [Lewinellaceae bacterium]|nr:anthranilate synthase component I family protein [Lewinella sp.]MCB9279145.1 anthranilate synthase component I family protein [Lewinellaceae bacterium]HMQ87458.1 anthranilate synthase component I family protein [Flavilitoribacter sp.]
MEAATAKKTGVNVRVRKILADTVTPVTLYLGLRDHYTFPVLLESNDFRSKEDCHSFIGLDSIASFKVQNGWIHRQFPDKSAERTKVDGVDAVPDAFYNFLQAIQPAESPDAPEFNGVFGHTGFDAVQYFDTLQFDPDKRRFDLPDIHYHFYRFVISFNHFKDELTILENIPDGEMSKMEELETRLKSRKLSTHPFRLSGAEQSNLTDEGFMELVTLGKKHCHLGDVFQIVFARQFSQSFLGDDFQVYRVLRSINPSPYLFYFDCGQYRIFGSSPETQMAVRHGVASVNPIAGTYRRTGDKVQDAENALALSKDPKENAEHIMLVDLARNDLGRHTTRVRVKSLKDIQFFSHVIHLVSKVEGDLGPDANPIRIFGDTFPAGTLSGAPKYKAIELINRYENQNRSFYGGALGYIGFNGDMNQAIVIRSFLSLDNTLYYQAGAGIVAASREAAELQEVNNKLGALKRALTEAEKI